MSDVIIEKLKCRDVKWLIENLFTDRKTLFTDRKKFFTDVGEIFLNKLFGESEEIRSEYIRTQYNKLSSEQQAIIKNKLIQLDPGNILLLNVGDLIGLNVKGITFSVSGLSLEPTSISFGGNDVIDTFISKVYSKIESTCFIIIDFSASEPVRYDVMLQLLANIHGYYRGQNNDTKQNDKKTNRGCLIYGTSDDNSMEMIKLLAETMGIKIIKKNDDTEYIKEIDNLLNDFGYSARPDTQAKKRDLLRYISEIKEHCEQMKENYRTTNKDKCNFYTRKIHELNNETLILAAENDNYSNTIILLENIRKSIEFKKEIPK
ncbi:MAG: hypothetical protein LBU83_07605 [Bacteroidales bacterium]|jgi:hypothetical protein|nr:hypothetical protein [Bacteroidales bacterium]